MNIFQKFKKQLKHALSEILLLEIFFENIDFQRRNYRKTLIGNNIFESRVRLLAFTQKLLQIE